MRTLFTLVVFAIHAPLSHADSFGCLHFAGATCVALGSARPTGVFVVAALLLRTPSACNELRLVNELLHTAEHGSSPIIQTSAISTLGDLRVDDKNAPATNARLLGLMRVLKSPPGPESVRDYYRFHVVRALGKLGDGARCALPLLNESKSTNKVLNDAIEAAVDSILWSTPKPKEAGNALSKLLSDLTDVKVATRLAAAQALGELQKDVNDAEAARILEKLLQVMKNDSDALVRRTAAESVRWAPASNVNATGHAKWVQEFVSALGDMIANRDSSEKVFACLMLGNLDVEFSCTPTALLKAAKDDKEKNVKCVATNVIEKIQSGSSKPKSSQ